MQATWHYWVLGGMLIAAGIDDVVAGKVHNVITLPCLAAGLLGHAAISGGMSLQDAIIGMAAGFLPAFVAWKFGAIGGGDVKLLAAVGALAGWRFTITAMFFGLCVAAVAAVAMLVAKKQLSATFRRIGFFAYMAAAGANPPSPTDQTSRKLPLGLALCVGCAIVMIIELAGLHCRFIWM
ncbi:MAG TPA: A24 family peptidase [Phycisphaerae bacterium]|nr:A24 family peptidase [Phycisphaerae bacterium]HPS53640.1 A24 family peptidase [Phycisphaerae bacterium]